MPTLEQLLDIKNPAELEALTDEEIRAFAKPYHNLTIPHLANPAGIKFGNVSVSPAAKESRKLKLETVQKKEALLNKLGELEGFDFMKDLLKGK